MPEWRASRYRPTAVFFEDERFAVRAHHAEEHRLHVYELTPWPDDGIDPPGKVIEYDEDYVRLRERQRSVGQISEVLAMLAVPLKPVLGLLPARVKAALQTTIGVHPVEATRASITLEGVVAFLCAALAIIHIATAGVSTPELVHTVWLLPLILADAFMRFDAVLKEETHPPGFLEWLLPARLWRPPTDD
jgi:hypothetical protein